MLDEIRETFTPFIEQRYETAKEKVELAKKTAQPRFYLKDLKAKLDALDIEQLMYLHLLFEMDYMDHCDFWFRDGCKEFPYQLNEMAFGMEEFRQALSFSWMSSATCTVICAISKIYLGRRRKQWTFA